jgi:hypothetical protein
MSNKPRPACENIDPEIFYPESVVNKNQYSLEGRIEINKGLDALSICAKCPVINWCTEYTFENLDSTIFGISAGLLPTEKRKMIGYNLKYVSEGLHKAIRRKATQAGIPVPPMPKRESPKSFYSINDQELLRERNAE